MAFEQGTIFGASVPSTNIWDVTEIYSADIDLNLKELLVRMYQNLNLMSNVVNVKTSGFYDTSEFITGDQYFPNPTLSSSSSTTPIYRPSYRKVINFGALPNNATKSVAHGITVNSGTVWLKIYATSTDPVNLLGLQIGTGNNNSTGFAADIDVDVTNVNITTNGNLTAFTTTIVVLEWLAF